MARGLGMSDELALAVIRTAFPSATIITEPQEETMPGNTHPAPPVLHAAGRQRHAHVPGALAPGARGHTACRHAAWRGGAGEGSLAHHSAITAAVRAVNR